MNQYTAGGYAYAPVGKRCLASLIDIAAIAIVAGLAYAAMFQYDGQRRIVFSLICALATVLLFWGWEATRGATLGKALCKLRTVREKVARNGTGRGSMRGVAAQTPDMRDGLLPVGVLRMSLRYAISLVSFACVAVGALLLEATAMMDGTKHRAWHDRICGTAVIDISTRYIDPHAQGLQRDEYDGEYEDFDESSSSISYTAAAATNSPAAYAGSAPSFGRGSSSIMPIAPIAPIAPAVATASAPPYAAPHTRLPQPSQPSQPFPQAPSMPSMPSMSSGQSGQSGPTRQAAQPALPTPTTKVSMPQVPVVQSPVSQSKTSSAVQPFGSNPSIPAPAAASAPALPQANAANAGGRQHESQYQGSSGADALHPGLPSVPGSSVPGLPSMSGSSMSGSSTPGPSITGVPAMPGNANNPPMPVDLPGYGLMQHHAMTAAMPKPATGAKAKLYFEDGTSFDLDIPSKAVLGRRPSSDDPTVICVRVPDPTGTMSRSHALLEVSAGKMWLTDLGSTNGTQAVTEDSGARDLVANKRIDIPFGTRISLGDTTLSVMLMRNRERKEAQR